MSFCGRCTASESKRRKPAGLEIAPPICLLLLHVRFHAVTLCAFAAERLECARVRHQALVFVCASRENGILASAHDAGPLYGPLYLGGSRRGEGRQGQGQQNMFISVPSCRAQLWRRRTSPCDLGQRASTTKV